MDIQPTKTGGFKGTVPPQDILERMELEALVIGSGRGRKRGKGEEGRVVIGGRMSRKAAGLKRGGTMLANGGRRGGLARSRKKRYVIWAWCGTCTHILICYHEVPLPPIFSLSLFHLSLPHPFFLLPSPLLSPPKATQEPFTAKNCGQHTSERLCKWKQLVSCYIISVTGNKVVTPPIKIQ